jgi:multidrug efflux system membrane fusion protein
MVAALTGGSEVAHAAAAKPAGGHHGAPGATAVTTAVAKAGAMPITETAIGWIEPVATVSVKPRIDGELATQHVTNGQFVKKGDLLFTLDDQPIRATIAKDEAAITKDQAVAVNAEADLKRAQALAATNAGTRQALDQAVANAKAAQATIAADQAALRADQLTLSYTRITAPVSGRLGAVQITPGNLVKGNDANTVLVTITQVQPIRVRFALPDREVDALRAALDAKPPTKVAVSERGASKPIRESGTLDFVDSTVDTASGTIQAKATLPNADLVLWPGEYVDVSLPLGIIKDATLVPAVAIQPGQNGSFVYVVKPDKTVDVRTVTVARTQDGVAAVTAGLKPGEHVVIEGQLHLAQGSPVVEHVQSETGAGGGAESRS